MPAVRTRGVPIRHDLLAGRLLLRHCKKRFADEVGRAIPTTVNWHDERWVTFQHRREAWLAEFAAIPTGTVRKLRPRASVEHQSSTYPLHWQFGVNAPLIPQNDFLQGDFYGDSWQGSFVRKLLEDLTPHRPFGFETSFSAELADHTAMKSEASWKPRRRRPWPTMPLHLHRCHRPDRHAQPQGLRPHGRDLRPADAVLRRAGRQAGRGRRCVLQPRLQVRLRRQRPVRAGADTTDAHTRSVTSVTRGLGSHHIPFGFITRTTLAHLNEHKVLILPNVNMMDDAEIEAIRDWVRQGGSLIATGWTSLVDARGPAPQGFRPGRRLRRFVEVAKLDGLAALHRTVGGR